MRTVVFEVRSTIGFCNVEVEDDNLSDELAMRQARAKIEDSGVDEPSRGINFFAEDGVEENEIFFRHIE